MGQTQKNELLPQSKSTVIVHNHHQKSRSKVIVKSQSHRQKSKSSSKVIVKSQSHRQKSRSKVKVKVKSQSHRQKPKTNLSPASTSLLLHSFMKRFSQLVVIVFVILTLITPSSNLGSAGQVILLRWFLAQEEVEVQNEAA
jgi:Flp pilus assembly protein TadB